MVETSFDYYIFQWVLWLIGFGAIICGVWHIYFSTRQRGMVAFWIGAVLLVSGWFIVVEANEIVMIFSAENTPASLRAFCAPASRYSRPEDVRLECP